MVRLTDRPDMTLDVYRGRKTTIQQQHLPFKGIFYLLSGKTNIKFTELPSQKGYPYTFKNITNYFLFNLLQIRGIRVPGHGE